MHTKTALRVSNGVENRVNRRVLVMENGSLFDEAMKALLTHDTGLTVSGVAYADETTFLNDVSRMSPDVIVLNDAGPLDAAQLCKLLEHIPARGALWVIVVRSDDNLIDLYKKQSVVASQSRDLLALIQSQ
jgi:DNA-binding NarL/FixJ family response regulator